MRWRNASSSPARARAMRSLFTAASSRQTSLPAPGDPVTHVDASRRGNRAPGVPGMPSQPRIVRRLLGGAGHLTERVAPKTARVNSREGGEVPGTRVALLHERTGPGRATRADPLPLEGLRERFLPERAF